MAPASQGETLVLCVGDHGLSPRWHTFRLWGPCVWKPQPGAWEPWLLWSWPMLLATACSLPGSLGCVPAYGACACLP